MTECDFYAEGLKLDAEERARKAKAKKSKSATVRKAIQRAMKTKTEENSDKKEILGKPRQGEDHK